MPPVLLETGGIGAFVRRDVVDVIEALRLDTTTSNAPACRLA